VKLLHALRVSTNQIHCLVPAGVLSFDHSRWISARKNFLFPVAALSRVFRGKFHALVSATTLIENIQTYPSRLLKNAF